MRLLTQVTNYSQKADFTAFRVLRVELRIVDLLFIVELVLFRCSFGSTFADMLMLSKISLGFLFESRRVWSI